MVNSGQSRILLRTITVCGSNRRERYGTVLVLPVEAAEVMNAGGDHVVVDIFRQVIGFLTVQNNEGSTLQPHLLSVFIISSAGGFCNARFVQSYKSFLYVINYFVILYILQLHLYASRGHFVLVVLPCLLHGIGGKKELARCGINFNVACYIPELCCHGNPCLSALLWATPHNSRLAA